jgi:hypothetical protein
VRLLFGSVDIQQKINVRAAAIGYHPERMFGLPWAG